MEVLTQPWEHSYYGTHGVLAAVMVQAFFISRYWSISRNTAITALLVVIMLAALGLGLYIAIRSLMFPQSSFLTLYAVYEVLKVWLPFAALTDITIAVALAFEMRKRRTGFFKTDSVLTRLALYGAATGAVTAIVVTIQLLLVSTRSPILPSPSSLDKQLSNMNVLRSIAPPEHSLSSPSEGCLSL
ncbi:hypothetical protein DL93DRAFT_2076086 [Clavulina sp. PMI_390]|nr:hypothetical protein DL93DRAFT_2076086 [Clavulina sp. PMI_390]